MYWLVLAALGDALIAILGCAGLLAGVWFIARGSRADADVPAASGGGEPPAAAAVADPAPAADSAGPEDPPPTAFRHGAIRVAGQPAREPEAAPAFVPPPLPPAPRTSFRQGRIRLGGLERGRGTQPPPDEPPDDAGG